MKQSPPLANDCMDAGGRVTQEQLPRGGLGWGEKSQTSVNKLSQDLNQKLNLETAQIRWHELQRYFASGNAIFVDPSLDLIQVAAEISEDNTAQIKTWMESGLLDVVKDSQAMIWYEKDASVWALVIKPWVLVQPVE